MSKWIFRAALIGLLTSGMANAQLMPKNPTPALLAQPAVTRSQLAVKVFSLGDLVCPPAGTPLAEPGDDAAMQAAAAAYTNARVEAVKKEVLTMASDCCWSAPSSLEYFPEGQSLLVVNDPVVLGRVGECLETMRKVRNTLVQVEVKLFKVPTDTDSVKKLFGDKSTATMTAEELKTLLDGLTKSGQLEVISAPKVTVSNKQTGFFQMLQQLPKDNRSVGVSCRMTPDVANDAKTIRLKVDVTNSSPSLELVELGHGLKAQPVDSQQTCTTLAMPNGGTGAVRLGIHKVEQKIEHKVPVLGDLPYLDRLFRNTAIGVQRVETIAVFTVSQVKPAAPVAVLPPLPKPHYLQHPPTQFAEPVQAVLPPLPPVSQRQYLPHPALQTTQASWAITPKSVAPPNK